MQKISLIEPYNELLNPSFSITSKDFAENQLRALMFDEFVVFDLETTGFKPEQGAFIIEIGAVKIKNGKIIERFSEFIDPNCKIPKKITELTSISQDMTYGQGRYNSKLKKFFKFVGELPVVAHNSAFDWDTFVKYYAYRIGIYPQNVVIDTLALARGLLPTGRHKLNICCEYLGISLVGAHRAVNDAEATAQMFIQFLNMMSAEPVSVSEAKKMFKKNKIEYIPQDIKRIRQWKKTDERMKEYPFEYNRIYVDLTYGKVFFDVVNKSWEVQESNIPIDFDDINKKFLKALQDEKRKEKRNV